MSVNLLQKLQDQFNPGVMEQAAQFLNTDRQKVKTAMNAALPAVLGHIIQRITEVDGGNYIMNLLRRYEFDGRIFDQLPGIFAGSRITEELVDSGKRLLNSLMSTQMRDLTEVISELSGLKQRSSATLINMVAPLIMEMIGKEVQERSLTTNGLNHMLLSQTKYINEALPAEVREVLGFDQLPITDNDDTVRPTGVAARVNYEQRTSLISRVISWGVPVFLILVGLYAWRSCGETGIDAIDEATGAVMNATEDIADGAREPAGPVAEISSTPPAAAGNMAEPVANTPESTLKAMKASAELALEGVAFAPGSIGDKFALLLAGEEDPVGESYSFQNLKFKPNSAIITEDSKMEIENLAILLEAYSSIEIEIRGHTDNQGSENKNQLLSQTKADAVKDFLISSGIAANRIESIGFGESEPIASNDTVAGRKQNSRIEVRITKM